MTEEDAKTKWCPFARVGMDGSRNRDDDCGPLAGCFCIGSSCMAWRWTKWMAPQQRMLGGGMSEPVESIWPVADATPSQGECGLSSR